MAKKKQAGHVAEICLYGNGPGGVGVGYLAQTKCGRHFGDGEPRRHRGYTDAVWLAVEEFKTAGIRSGLCRVYAPGNSGRMAEFPLDKPAPYFGDLQWVAAPVFVIDAAEIERVAAEQAGAGK